jgi:hypothetical protein
VARARAWSGREALLSFTDIVGYSISITLLALGLAMLLSGCAVVLAGCEYEIKHTAKCEVGK